MTMYCKVSEFSEVQTIINKKGKELIKTQNNKAVYYLEVWKTKIHFNKCGEGYNFEKIGHEYFSRPQQLTTFSFSGYRYIIHHTRRQRSLYLTRKRCHRLTLVK